MSNITIAGNAAGTATFTVAAPATNTDRTITLPDETGTLATQADVSTAAADAVADAVAAAGGMTLLGTLSTGAQTLSGLTLTDYKQLFFDFNGVSHNNGTTTNVLVGAGLVHSNVTATDLLVGGVWVSLWSGIAMPILTRQGATLPNSFSPMMAQTGYTNAATSVGVSFSSGTIDAGSVRVYGVK